MKKIFIFTALCCMSIYKAYAWVYFYVDFCNNTPFRTSYDLNAGSNEFSNGNVFNLPATGKIEPGQYVGSSDDIYKTWWASSDNATFRGHNLDFLLAGKKLTLVNPSGSWVKVMCSGLSASYAPEDPIKNNFHLEFILNYDVFTGSKYITVDNPLSNTPINWRTMCSVN